MPDPFTLHGGKRDRLSIFFSIFFDPFLFSQITMAATGAQDAGMHGCDPALSALLTKHGVADDVITALVDSGVYKYDTFANVCDANGDVGATFTELLAPLATMDAGPRTIQIATLRAAFREAVATFEQNIAPKAKKFSSREDDPDDNECIGEDERLQLAEAFKDKYGHSLDLDLQGCGSLLARIQKHYKKGVAEIIPLSRALPATVLAGDEKQHKIGDRLFLKTGPELTKARPHDSGMQYIYHLKILMHSYVMVSAANDPAWCTLDACLKHIWLVEKILRTDARFGERSFRKITATEENVRCEWYKEMVGNPGATLSQVIDRVANRFQSMWPTEQEMREKQRSTARPTLVPRGGPYVTTTRAPPTRTPRNLKDEPCRMHREGRCQWGANCRYRHD